MGLDVPSWEKQTKENYLLNVKKLKHESLNFTLLNRICTHMVFQRFSFPYDMRIQITNKDIFVCLFVCKECGILKAPNSLGIKINSISSLPQ